MSIDYDVITIGGGLDGAAIVRMLAENGKHVLVMEREIEFKDRIRGEPFVRGASSNYKNSDSTSVLARNLLMISPYVNPIGMGPVRDLRTTTPLSRRYLFSLVGVGLPP